MAYVTMPPGSKPPRKYHRCKSQQEGEQWVAQQLRDLADGDGLLVADERLTVRAYLTDWPERRAATGAIRPNTYRQYKYSLAHVIDAYGDLRLTKLTASYLDHLFARLQKPKSAGGEGLTGTSARLVYVVLRKALKDAVRRKLVKHNVTDMIDAPKANLPLMVRYTSEEKRPRLTLDEAKRLLAVVRGDRLEALYVLLVKTGMRIGECLGLQWSAVDLEAATLDVRATLTRDLNDALVLADPKTEHGRRRIDLPLDAVEALRAHKARQGRERMAHLDAWRNQPGLEGLVFCDELGGPLIDTSLEKYKLQQALTLAGLPHKRFTDLRHTAATLHREAGHDITEVQALLGHSNSQITSTYYAHFTPKMSKALAATMDRLFASDAG